LVSVGSKTGFSIPTLVMLVSCGALGKRSASALLTTSFFDGDFFLPGEIAFFENFDIVFARSKIKVFVGGGSSSVRQLELVLHQEHW